VKKKKNSQEMLKQAHSLLENKTDWRGGKESEGFTLGVRKVVIDCRIGAPHQQWWRSPGGGSGSLAANGEEKTHSRRWGEVLTQGGGKGQAVWGDITYNQSGPQIDRGMKSHLKTHWVCGKHGGGKKSSVGSEYWWETGGVDSDAQIFVDGWLRQ